MALRPYMYALAVVPSLLLLGFVLQPQGTEQYQSASFWQPPLTASRSALSDQSPPTSTPRTTAPRAQSTASTLQPSLSSPRPPSLPPQSAPSSLPLVPKAGAGATSVQPLPTSQFPPLRVRSLTSPNLDDGAQSGLDILFDGKVDKSIDLPIVTAPKKVLPKLEIEFEEPANLWWIHLHLNKEQRNMTFRGMKISLFNSSGGFEYEHGFEWAQQTPVGPDKMSISECPYMVPDHIRSRPVQRVVITCVCHSASVLWPSELLFFTRSNDVPTPVMYKGTVRALLYSTPLPSKETRAEAEQLCALRPRPEVLLASPKRIVAVPPTFDCVIVSALFGTIERTLKLVVPQRRECDRIVFTDREDLKPTAKAQGWRVVTYPHHLDHPQITAESHPFLKAKFYKQQFHRLLPPHVRHAIWVDATVTLKHANVTHNLLDALERRASIGVLHHPSFHVLNEVHGSTWKYMAVFNVFDYLVGEYVAKVREGFCELFWQDTPRPAEQEWPYLTSNVATGYQYRDTCPLRLRTLHTLLPIAEDAVRSARRAANNTCRAMGWGVPKGLVGEALSAPRSQGLRGLTCIMSFDLTKQTVRLFLDDWWRISYYHWQDQVAFNLNAWKYGLIPLYLDPLLWTEPRENIRENRMTVLLPHGW